MRRSPIPRQRIVETVDELLGEGDKKKDDDEKLSDEERKKKRLDNLKKDRGHYPPKK